MCGYVVGSWVGRLVVLPHMCTHMLNMLNMIPMKAAIINFYTCIFEHVCTCMCMCVCVCVCVKHPHMFPDTPTQLPPIPEPGV